MLNLSGSKSAYIVCASILMGNKSSFVNGYTNLVATKPAFVYGNAPIIGFKTSYLQSTRVEQINHPSYIVGTFKGIDITKLAFTNGASARGQIAGSKSAYLQSGITSLNAAQKNAYIESSGTIDCWELNDGVSTLADTNQIENGTAYNGATFVDGPGC